MKKPTQPEDGAVMHQGDWGIGYGPDVMLFMMTVPATPVGCPVDNSFSSGCDGESVRSDHNPLQVETFIGYVLFDWASRQPVSADSIQVEADIPDSTHRPQ